MSVSVIFMSCLSRLYFIGKKFLVSLEECYELIWTLYQVLQEDASPELTFKLPKSLKFASYLEIKDFSENISFNKAFEYAIPENKTYNSETVNIVENFRIENSNISDNFWKKEKIVADQNKDQTSSFKRKSASEKDYALDKSQISDIVLPDEKKIAITNKSKNEKRLYKSSKIFLRSDSKGG
ncbi:hypothetical protein HK096_011084, partial [Nowakowskiella sp. JEL0078]